MGKEIGPLQQFQKDADKFKKQIDKQVKDSNKTATNSKTKNDETKLKEFFKGCYDIKEQVDDLLQRANDLAEDKEPAKIKDFEKKKNAEIKRITTWQTQLQGAMDKLLPGEKGESYLKELKGEEEEDEYEDEEEEGEDEGEEEEDEGEDEEDTTLADTEKDKTAEVKEDEDEDDEEEEEEETDEEEDTTDQKKPVVTNKEHLQKEEKEADEEESEEEEEEDEEGEEEEEEDEEEEEEEEKTDETKEKKARKKKDVAEDTLEVTEGARLFEALCDYKGQQPGDLSFKQGEIITITNTRDDGWWEAENEKGETGVVPSTFLQAYNKYKDVQQDDEEEEEDEEGEAEDEEGLKTSRSGKKFWGSIKKAVNETSASDVLHAFGALPSGYRPSTLKPMFNKDYTYRMKNYLAPKLSKSNLFYRDVFFDPQKSKIISRQGKFDRIITITGCRQIPVPTQAVTVKSRFVRVCLFDGQHVLSNIHIVNATSADKEEKTWSFSTKVSDVMETFQHAEVFVRTNHLPEKVGVLFELGFTYMRNSPSHESSSSEETGEVSCGWVLVDLYEPTGVLVGNKTCDLYVNGGTPYEKNIEVDPAISRRTSSNAFMSLLSGNKQPRLNIKISIPNREKKEQLDILPDVLVGNASLINMYSYYRQILADTLLKDRVDLESTELIHNPLLASFPDIADEMDLMKVLREAWIERSKAIRAPEKSCKKILFDLDANIIERDIEYMKTEFQLVFQNSVYPIMHLANLPKWQAGDFKQEQKRQEEIHKFQKQKLERKGMLAMLLSSDVHYQPFDMNEVAFNVIGPYCQNDPMLVTVSS